ncbi:hypothetical protein [Streptomyces barringtoniae]|uniref:hypothetical protein n=1 Tax=Streptomyces barringtoniae TaxID=2892029 RepID=UPI0027E311B9|nr:hypothetical protein [Streptomyces barringtoniae]
MESVPLADEEYLLVASPNWARRIAAQPQASAYLCADLREVSLITYAENLLNVRRYSRTIFGRQLTATRA